MYRARKNRRVVIGVLLILLLMVSVGYAAFQTRLTIRGTSRITSNWDVRITNVTTGVATGDAENVSTPTWTDLTAYMEANLYDKGAAMDYDVTISNRGTFDAKLDNIITTPSSNEAVIITFSGYTKGEMLPKGQDKVIHVKIQYNPNYNGTAEVSGTSIVEFQYVQGEGSNIPTVTTHLLTYNYSENGGTSMNAENEYLPEGTVVNLTGKTAVKPGYTNVIDGHNGCWNTDKNAHTCLQTVTMTADTTLYAIFKKDVTVTFDKNGAVSQTNSSGTAVTTNTVTRECTMWNKDATCNVTSPTAVAITGYTIAGYNESSSAATSTWNANAEKAVADNGTYYVIQKPNNYTVIFNANGGTGTMQNQTLTYDTPANLTKNTFTNSGYSFRGWNGLLYSNSSEKSGGTGEFFRYVDLAPYFDKYGTGNTYHLELDLKSKDISNKNTVIIYFQSSTPTRYAFDTFDGNKTTTGQKSVTVSDSTWTHVSFDFTIKNGDQSQAQAHLAFFGDYNTGNVPVVKNVRLTLVPDFTDEQQVLNLTDEENGEINLYAMWNIPIIRSWASDASTDFHNATYRENITSIVFENHTNVPNGATSWDVSAAHDESVIAWVTADPNDNTKYVLHIGGDGGVIANEDSSNIFRSFTAVTSISFGNNYDTSNVEDFSYMFYDCNKVTSLDVSSFDTRSATTMDSMFRRNRSLTSLNVSNFDTSNVTNMSSMFSSSGNLVNLNLSGFDTKKVTTMNGMFYGCSSLASLDLSDFDTRSVTDMNCMFMNCSSLPSLNLNNFNTSKVTDMNQMFAGMTNAQVIFFCNADTDLVTDMQAMFINTSSLNAVYVGSDWTTANANINGIYDNSGISAVTKLDNCRVETEEPVMKKWTDSAPGGATYLNTTDFHVQAYRENITSIIFEDSINVPNGATSWDVSAAPNTGNVIAWVVADSNDNTKYILHIGGDGGVISSDDLGFTFRDFTALTSIDLSKLDTSNATAMYGMFQGDAFLSSITFGNDFDTSNVEIFNYMFAGDLALTSLDLSGFDTSSATEMVAMFYCCKGLTSLDLSNFNTSKVTNMSNMFQDCLSLASLDVNDFDTSKVTNMSHMFAMFDLNDNLTSLDVSGFDTSKVTDMSDMFFGNSALTNLDVSNFDTGNVTTMVLMFYGCSSLTDLDLSNFNTSKVTDMRSMFQNCSSLTKLNLNSFDTSSVIEMESMFNGDNDGNSSLKVIYMCNADTSNVTNMKLMFADLPRIEAIYVGNGWTTANATTTSMFSNGNISSVTKLDNCKVTSGRPIMKRWPIEYNQNVETDFHATEYRTKITSVDVVTKINIPSGATSWDVSEASDGSVMAWVVDDGNNGYKLYIGGEGGVIANPTNSSWVFKEFTALTDVNVANLDVSEVREMYGMFYGSTSLTSLDLATWDTGKAKQMGGVFQNCTHLTTIYVSDDFTVGQATNTGDMFSGDTAIVGGNGTTYSSSNTGGAYAKIDKPGQVGYFTNGIYPVITNVSTQTTSSTATLIVDAYVPNGESITNYEFSIDGGTTWVTQTNGNISPNMYTFTGLNAGTNYDVQVRVTSQSNNKTIKTVSATTKQIEAPTFGENISGEVSIDFPTGCTSPYICSYSIDGGEPTPVTTNSVTLPFGTDGTVRAIVSDGTSEETTTYNLRKTDLYVSVNGNDTTGVGTVAQPYATIDKAYSSASSTTASTIYVMNNIEQSTQLNMNANKSITLTSSDSNGVAGGAKNTVTRTNNAAGAMIEAKTGTLKLQNIVINGNNLQLTDSFLLAIADGEIAEGTTIKNSDSGALVVDGGTVAMTGGTIKNNSVHGGVRVQTNSTFTLSNGTIRENTTTASGGGIWGGTGSTININGGLIYNNGGGSGGGIYSGGTVNITGGSISNNDSAGNGGGITGYYGSTINISGGTIENNSVPDTDKAGGGIFIVGSSTDPSTLTVSGTAVITGNSAHNGGGIGMTAYTTVNINDGTITGNTAQMNGGGIQSSASTNNTLNIRGGTISDNSVENCGGGITFSGNAFNMSGGTITGNTADINSGGILLSSSATMTMSGGTISNNSSKIAGGINVYGGSSFNMTAGTISGNNATSSHGGGIALSSTGVNSATISGGTITENTAKSNGAGIVVYNSSSGTNTLGISGTTKIIKNAADNQGGGIYNGGNLTITGGTIGGSSANKNTSGAGGGGVYNASTGTMELSGATISYNTSLSGGGIQNYGTLTIDSDGTVTRNKSTSTGGGIWSAGTLKVYTGAIITYNEAGGGGGGIWSTYTGSTAGKLTITGGTITNNKGTTGGGIGLASNSISVTQSISGSTTTISNNNGTTNGGGIFLNNANITLTLSQATISSNTTAGSGGGIFLNGGRVNMSSGTIASNKTTGSSSTGGGVRIQSGATFALSGGTIKKNTSKTNGGISAAGTYTRTNGYVCKNNSPTNSYDVTATTNTNCS